MESFIIIPIEILSRKDLSSSAKILAGTILSLQGSRGYCFASNSYLAEKVGMSVSRTRILISELCDSGLLNRDISLGENKQFNERKLIIDINIPMLENNHTPAHIQTYPMTENEHTPLTENEHIINKSINKKNNKKSTIDSSLRDSKFEEFWEAYGKKTGKQSTKNHWAKLKESEYDEIIRATKKYVELRPDAVYRKDPERFLKHKVYEEDFLKETRPVNQTTTALSDSSFEAQIPEEWL